MEIVVGEREHCKVIGALSKCVAFLLNFITLGTELFIQLLMHGILRAWISPLQC